MYELIDFIYSIKDKPLNIIVLAVFLFLLEKLGRKLITSQVKRLFHIDDQNQLKQYAKRQQRIESKVDLLLQKEGITWSAPMSPTGSEDTATKNARLSLSHWIISSLVRFAKRFIKLWRCNMSNINKGTLIMLISAIANFLKTAYGYELPSEQIDFYAELILWIFTIAGVVMNFSKKKEMPKTDDKEAYYH